MKHATIAATILFALSGAALAASPGTNPGGETLPPDTVAVDMHYFDTHVSSQGQPTRIVCDKRAPDFLVALDGAMADRHILISKKGSQWQKEVFGLFGYTTQLPVNKKDGAAAQRVLELLRHENLAAAQIANLEAARVSPDYQRDPFYAAAALYIRNGTIPSEDMDVHSTWLAAAATQMKVGQQRLGPLFQKSRAARFHLMGNAYDDGLAVDAAQRVLCATEKSPVVINAIAKAGAAARTRRP